MATMLGEPLITWEASTALAGCPARPEACAPGSAIARSLAEIGRAEREAAAVRAELEGLGAQLAGYRATVANATPRSDMGELAAALAGQEVLVGAIRALEARLPGADQATRDARVLLDEEWAAVERALADAWQRGLVTSDTLADLRRLVGPFGAGGGAGGR